MSTKEKQFLLELADLVEKFGAEFYYTIDDDGIHIKLDDSSKDCFVGFGPRPCELRTAAVNAS